ncbi:DNA polymerase V [Rhodanobacter sp. K2T2]|uniref:LexA family protein n=1 Tax=Rhodanobacter sp. K2T2 TaxID=2723085 RepID=UPI0017E8D58C|nr:DNA polymerase V [Rhodanobacter sp. K2T2]
MSQKENIVNFLAAYREASTAVGPRPISLLPTAFPLPTFASGAAAGFPSPASDYIDDSIDINAEMIIPGHEACTFILKVLGLSMYPILFDQDRIVVDRGLDPIHGDIVVAILNNELTVKTLGNLDGKLALVPANAHFKPIVMQDGDHLEIWGVVTNCLRNFKRGGR